MSTDVELFETVTTWESNNRRHQRTNIDTAECPEAMTGPLRALHATHELIESLQAGRWEMITAARLAGVSWSEIAFAVNDGRTCEGLRVEYASLVNWYSSHPSICVNIKRWQAALHYKHQERKPDPDIATSVVDTRTTGNDFAS